MLHLIKKPIFKGIYGRKKLRHGKAKKRIKKSLNKITQRLSGGSCMTQVSETFAGGKKVSFIHKQIKLGLINFIRQINKEGTF